MEFELVSYTSGASDDDGYVVLEGHECDGFVGCCFSAEEVYEDVFDFAVLVADDSERFAVAEYLVHGFGGAFFEDNGFGAMEYFVNVAVDVWVVDWSGDVVGWQAEGVHGSAEDFEVAVMAGDHDKALALKEQLQDFSHVAEFDVTIPVVGSDETRGVEDIEGEHYEVFKAASGGELVPLFGFFGVAEADVG